MNLYLPFDNFIPEMKQILLIYGDRKRLQQFPVLRPLSVVAEI